MGLWGPEAAAPPNRFRPKPRVSQPGRLFVSGQLRQSRRSATSVSSVSHVCLVGQPRLSRRSATPVSSLSHVCLVGQSRLSRRSVPGGKMMMEWERHRGQCNRSPGIYITTEDKFTTPQFGNRRTVGDLQDLGGQNSFLQLLKTANVFSHNYTTNSGQYVNINILTVYTRGKT